MSVARVPQGQVRVLRLAPHPHPSTPERSAHVCTAPLSAADSGLQSMALRRAVLLAGLLAEVTGKSSEGTVSPSWAVVWEPGCQIGTLASGPLVEVVGALPLTFKGYPGPRDTNGGFHRVQGSPCLLKGPPLASAPCCLLGPFCQTGLAAASEKGLCRAAQWHRPEPLGACPAAGLDKDRSPRQAGSMAGALAPLGQPHAPSPTVWPGGAFQTVPLCHGGGTGWLGHGPKSAFRCEPDFSPSHGGMDTPCHSLDVPNCPWGLVTRHNSSA